MKTVFVVSGKSAVTLPGGLGAYALNLARALHRLEYRVFLVGFSDRDEEIDREFGTLVHVRTPFNKLVSLGVSLMVPYLTRRMETIARKEHATEVTVFGAAIWGMCGLQLKQRLATKGIKVHTFASYFTTYEHEYLGQVKGAPGRDYGLLSHLFVRSLYIAALLLFRPKEHRLLRSLDRVIVHYDSTEQILLREVRGLAPGQIDRVPYYIDIYPRDSDTQPHAANQQGIVRINVICRQDPRKGISTFLHALRILIDRDVTFTCTIAGSGFFLERHRKLAARLCLQQRVHFAGFVRSVEELLDETDIYVLPSVEEGSGAIALMEAMKKGVAIVTTDCDGMPEDFDHGETALLVPPADHVAMADALERLVTDHDLRATLARNVYADYPQRFSFDDMVEGLRGFLARTT